jgi:NADPH:quinone reductase-like Zn-dependent oxidoreductase
LEVVAVGGRISLIGLLEGFDVQGGFAPFVLKTIVVQGISVEHRRSLEDLVRAVDRADIKPVIDKSYKFEELSAAPEYLDWGPFGKIVITINQ